ncbi:MAG: alpha/beta fold hydrolase [Thermoplasmata archaeon]|nr:alpha/beta fold hydrolase [Thermoplasmata archaeon]
MSAAYHSLPRREVGGTHLCYDLHGEGPVVVFLHGFTLDLRMWEDQLPAFVPRFRVLRYDLRGFGRSDLPSVGAPYRPADDLRALLSSLGLSRVHLVGLSAGGAVALDFALEHPDLVGRLVLVDSALGGFEWSPAVVEGWDRIDRLAQADGVEAARQAWLADPLFEGARNRPEVRERLETILREYSGWHWLQESPSRGADPPAVQRLASVASPTLVLVGEHDLPDFHRIATVLAEGIPSARRVSVPGAGHMLNMEAPAEFNRLVLEFLDSPAPSRQAPPR